MPAVRQAYSPSSSLAPLYPGHAGRTRVRLAPGLYLRGTVLAEQMSSPGVFFAYQPGGRNGAGTARVILEHDCRVGDDGVAWEGSLAEGEGTASGTASAFFAGDFNTQELVGLDAGAARTLGHIVEGDVQTGILRV
jgi:hypothetical protein